MKDAVVCVEQGANGIEHTIDDGLFPDDRLNIRLSSKAKIRGIK